MKAELSQDGQGFTLTGTVDEHFQIILEAFMIAAASDDQFKATFEVEGENLMRQSADWR